MKSLEKSQIRNQKLHQTPEIARWSHELVRWSVAGVVVDGLVRCTYVHVVVAGMVALTRRLN